MGKKTIVPIGSKELVLEKMSLTLTSGQTQNKTFSTRVVQILIRFTDANGQVGDMYYCNPKAKFWNDISSNMTNFKTPFKGYIYNTARYVQVQYVSDTEVQFYNNSSTTVTLECVVLRETDVFPKVIFLLSNTILYTDGTVSSSVSGAIQTLETNKYKIKANALVTIQNATYANISN